MMAANDHVIKYSIMYGECMRSCDSFTRSRDECMRPCDEMHEVV